MAFSDFEISDSNNTLKSVSTSVIPTNGWQIEILQLPFSTTLEEIQTLFTKYGTIDRVAIIYKVKDRSLNCYLSFVRESDSVDALRENGKKVGTSSITVIKYGHISDGDKGNKRMRSESTTDGWGSTTNSDTKANNDEWGAATSDTSGGWGSSNAPLDSWGGANNSNSGGRRRGRGGAGRGGGRACFKCGEEGHMSRECPKGGGGGGGSRNCFKCGQEGHISRDCPKGGGRACFNCGDEGHMSRECSKPRRGRGGGLAGGNGNNRNNSNTEWDSSESTTSKVAFSSATTDWD